MAQLFKALLVLAEDLSLIPETTRLLKPLLTPVSGDLVPFSDFYGTQECLW